MAIFRTQLSVTIISSKGAVVFQLCVGVHSVPTKIIHVHRIDVAYAFPHIH